MVELLTDQLRHMAGEFPTQTAYVNTATDTSITFEHWNARSNRIARGLAKVGIDKGDRIAIYVTADHVLDWIVYYAALHKLAAVAVPLNTRLSDHELRAIHQHAEPAATIVSTDLLTSDRPIDRAFPAPHPLIMDSDGHDLPAGTVRLGDILADDASDTQAPVAADDLADIMYTSGTTGRPKGVAVTYETLAVSPNSTPEWTGDAWLTAAPLFTFAGLGFVYSPMKMGMTALYLPRFTVDAWFDNVEARHPTAVFVVPALAELIVAHPRFAAADLTSLRICTLGSAPLAPATLRALQDRLPDAVVLNSYGMTEGGPSVFSMDPEGQRKYPDAVGRPMPPTEVRIVDEAGEPRPVGAVGEVVTRNFRGRRRYYNDPEATADTWRDGWLHSGDLGFLNDDGYLHIVGRAKDMIIRGGHNVYAAEVEAALYEDDRIKEAAVVGIPHDVLGEDLLAYVVLNEGHDGFDAAGVAAHCAGRLADYKVPRTVRTLAALPRNATGKVLKRELVALWEADDHDDHDRGRKD